MAPSILTERDLCHLRSIKHQLDELQKIGVYAGVHPAAAENLADSREWLNRFIEQCSRVDGGA